MTKDSKNSGPEANVPRGVIVPTVTPLTGARELDEKGVARLVEGLVESGVDGLFVAGTTGEALALPASVRREAIRQTVKVAGGQVSVVAGIGAACFEDVVDYAHAATEAGADFLALQPPSFFPMDHGALVQFYLQVLEETTLPLILYNIPGFTGNSITPEVALELCRHPGVIGLKDSTGDAEYFRRIMDACHGPDFAVYMGDETMMVMAMRAGAEGLVPSTANAHPELLVEFHRACREGSWDRAAELEAKVMSLTEPFRAGGGWIQMIRWLKSELSRKGICQEHVASLFPVGKSPDLASVR